MRKLEPVSERFCGKVVKSYSPCYIPGKKDDDGKMQWIKAKKISGMHVIKEVWKNDHANHIILKCWDGWNQDMTEAEWHSYQKKNG